MAAFAEFIAPYETTTRFRRYQQAPPSTIHWSDENGFRGPFVYAVEQERHPVTRRVTFVENRETLLPIRFFVETEPYKLWGVFELRHKLFGLGAAGEKARVGIWLFGLDSLARDVFSRTVYGARISLTIGVVSVVLTFVLGTLLGGISGYFGGLVDNIIQRIIEFLRAIPQLPLWMTLAAAVPKEWPPINVYFAITLILALLNWVGLARVVRGRLLSMREDKIVTVDELRRGIEELPPELYDTIGYYERWIASLSNILVEKDVLGRAELDARVRDLEAGA